MSGIIFFLVVIGAIAGWWLSKQRLMAKPWLEEGISDGFHDLEAVPTPAAKVGLGIFLAVVGALFALLISAYTMRMQMSDWRPVPNQAMLWPVTGLLVMSSIALEWAKAAAQRRDLEAVRVTLIGAALFALSFLIGQLLVLRHLTEFRPSIVDQPCKFFLLSDRRPPRPSHAGWSGRSGKGDRNRLERASH